MFQFKKSHLFAAITCVSMAVGYVEARIGALFERIDRVQAVIAEGRETLETLKRFAEQLEELETEQFLFPLPAVPTPRLGNPQVPAPPPLEPVPDPVGASGEL